MKYGFSAVWSFAWSYWRTRPYSMAALAVGIAVATLADVSIPFAIGALTDVIASEDGSAGEAIRWLLLLTGFAVLYHLAHKSGDYLWCRVQVDIMRRIGADAFARVQRYSAEWHSNTFAGKTVRNISRGIWEFDQFGDLFYFNLVPAGSIIVGIVVVLSVRLPLLAIVFVIGVAIYLAVSLYLNVYYVAPRHRQVVQTDSELSGSIADAVTCNTIVKATAAEAREDHRLGYHFDTWQCEMRTAWHSSINTAVAQSALLVLLQLGLVAAAISMWAQGHASPGDVTFVLFITFLMMAHLRDVGQYIRDLQQAVNDLEPVVAYAQKEPEIEDPPSARPLRPHGGSIRFEHVDFGYRKTASWLFRDLNIEVGVGERVALVGRSGSGKTTFTKLLQRLYDVDAGRITIDGQDIATATLRSLRRAIALVPQDPVLFHRSLRENIAYARPDATAEEILRAADQAHATEFIDDLEREFDTLVGERGVKLSGGERQRIAIARAILADAPILILDEATSALDSVSEGLIQDALRHLMAGRTTIVIAHRLSTIREVDRILVFDSGQIVESGSHDRLIASGGVYAKLYNTQVKVYAA
ncbi:MAG: ABC transporter ATP-binding protein [Pseudomonadota bacterium]